VIGTIAIHAGMGRDPLKQLPHRVKKPRSEDLIQGAIIGVVEIEKVVKGSRSEWFIGPLGWVLRKPRPLRKPIRCTGRLGLWKLSPRVAKAIEQQLSVKRRRRRRNGVALSAVAH
jgi:hypothetical protein